MQTGNNWKNINSPAEVDITRLAELKLTEYDGSQALSPLPKNMRQRKHSLPKERETVGGNQRMCTVTEPGHAESFPLQGGSKSARKKTSKSTLSSLCDSDPSCLIDPVTFEKLSGSHESNHAVISKKIHANLCTQFFSRWPFYLSEGFNILLYGVGSKRALLEDFRKRHLGVSNCVIVPGYDPSVTIKHILNAICHDWLQLPAQRGTLADQLLLISEKMNLPNASEAPLYILIHNLDGTGLRNTGAQSTLARLASIPNIHILASVDHLNISLLWSHDELARFCWIWEDCTSFMDHTVEVNYSNNPLLQHLLGGLASSGGAAAGCGGTALVSLRRVAASLTQNARDIFRTIAVHQLNAPLHEATGSTAGMPLEDLYWRCRDAFLTNNEATLRAQLTEFRDHELLKIRKGPDGTELLFIPMDNTYLRKFVDDFDSFC
ncbi:unnamed protein product [Dicrocoelium dendriticum]|nr:unnamed protein product [Dicrocoelium dendriticum]